MAIPIWKKFSELIARPKIKFKKAPKNVFEYLKPTSSKDRVKDLLGAPHNVLGSKWCYEFLDAAIQIDFYEEGNLEYIQGLSSEELIFTTRIGPPSYWKQFHFGVLWPLYGAAVYESGFEWDHEAKKLKTPAENILINWVGISRGSDEVCFEWQY